MKIGSTPITDIKVGSTQITKVIKDGVIYWTSDISYLYDVTYLYDETILI